jgi:hypothetical protein
MRPLLAGRVFGFSGRFLSLPGFVSAWGLGGICPLVRPLRPLALLLNLSIPLLWVLARGTSCFIIRCNFQILDYSAAERGGNTGNTKSRHPASLCGHAAGDRTMVRERLQRLKAGAIEEIKKLFWITLYVWVLLSLFSFHKALVLKEQYILYDQLFALVNAVVLAKVILIGEFAHIGEKLENRPLIYPVLFKAAIFAVLLIVFRIAEESLRGEFMEGKTLSESLYSY